MTEPDDNFGVRPVPSLREELASALSERDQSRVRIAALEREVAAHVRDNSAFRLTIARQIDQLTLARAQVCEQAAKVCDDEPELPGPQPYEIMRQLETDPVGVLRAVVRATKLNISRRIRAMPLEGGE